MTAVNVSRACGLLGEGDGLRRVEVKGCVGDEENGHVGDENGRVGDEENGHVGDEGDHNENGEENGHKENGHVGDDDHNHNEGDHKENGHSESDDDHNDNHNDNHNNNHNHNTTNAIPIISPASLASFSDADASRTLLVLTGATIATLPKSAEFFAAAARFKGAICCRVTPKQKVPLR